MGLWNNQRLRQAGKYAKSSYLLEARLAGLNPTEPDRRAMREAWDADIKARRERRALPERPGR